MSRIRSQVSLAKIGAYPVLEKIGTGATGTIYKGQDPSTGKPVAIKVIPGKVVAPGGVVRSLRLWPGRQVPA
jgi:serine/threonine protein kinase